jgi:predicted acylesterase/phospholipase RssA
MDDTTIVPPEEDNSSDPTIRHLVISGGGINGLSYYGVLRDSCIAGVWHPSNICSVYGCSFGSILAAIIALKYDWIDMDNYILKRPWENVFESNVVNMLHAFSDKGIYHRPQMEAIMAPLLLGKDLSADITLSEFYEATQLEIHLFTTDIHSFCMVDLSYKTHPAWRLIDAIYASCAVPVVFAPYTDGTTYYYDGAFFANYPVKFCIDDGAKPEEIMGITSKFSQMKKAKVEPDSNLFDCVSVVFENILRTALHSQYTGKLGVEYKVDPAGSTLSDIYNTISNREERARLINVGANAVRSAQPAADLIV